MCSFRSLGWIHGIGPLWCSASRVSSVHQDPEPPGTSCSTPIMNSSHVRKSLYLQWATLESWNVKPALYYWTWVIYIDLVFVVFFTFWEESECWGERRWWWWWGLAMSHLSGQELTGTGWGGTGAGLQVERIFFRRVGAVFWAGPLPAPAPMSRTTENRF